MWCTNKNFELETWMICKKLVRQNTNQELN